MSLMQNLRRFHRWHALIMSVVVISSAGSGLIHTWMSRTQAPPPKAGPTRVLHPAHVTVAPSAVPDAIGIADANIVSLGLRPLGERTCYQVIVQGLATPIYVDGNTGTVVPDADAEYAKQIAMDALGGEPVVQSELLTAYNEEYIPIFRILPVYRFDTGDNAGNRVYVSTLTGSVTRATNDGKQREAWTFTNLHKWGFIHNRDWRDGALMVAMLSLVVLSFGGIVLFVLTRKRRPAASSVRGE
jgi:hypothetical protein